MRVGIYARCSTNLGQRPEIQVDELKTIAKNNSQNKRNSKIY